MELQSLIDLAVRKLKSKDLDDFEVVGISDSFLSIEAKKQMVDSFRRSLVQGLAIRALKGGRVGFSATTDLAPRDIEQAINRAVESMNYVVPTEECRVPTPQEPKESLVETLGRPFAEIPDNEKARVAIAMESEAIAFDSRIVRASHPRYYESTRAMAIVNSKGINTECRRGLAFCELKAVAKNGDESEGAYEFSYSPRFEDLKFEETAELSAKRALAKLGGRPVEAGSYTVIFDPRAAQVIVRLVAPSFYADNIQRQKSALVARRGEKFYHQLVSIIDDGLLSGGLGSFAFDGEGIPKRRTIMAKDGVIAAWLYDGFSAVRDKAESTGNSVRESLRRVPAIGVGNCFLKAGKLGQGAIIKQVQKGLMVTDLFGVHTANTISGDFSLGAEGFLIENGVTTRPVRGITVAGNVHELLRRVVAIGSDLKFFGTYGAPSVLVEDLMVGA